MKLRLPFALRSSVDAQMRAKMDHMAAAVRFEQELKACRSSAIGETQAHAYEVFKLKDQLATAQALGAEKQREIAMLRTQLAEKEAALQAERTAAADERHKLMDWIAKGVSNGVPIFAEIPAPVVTEEPAAPAKAAVAERVPTEVEAAIATVGRKARAIVNHITKNKDANFEAEMAGAGVKRLFQEDKAEAEAEAVVLSESK